MKALPEKTIRNASRRTFPLRYGILEKRNLLTSYLVDTLLDDASGIPDGKLSIREAVIAASTNAAFGDAPAGEGVLDEIRFDVTLQDATITLAGAALQLTEGISFWGGDRNVTIDAADQSRVFELSGPGDFNLSGMTLSGGTAETGGGIFASGSSAVRLTRMTLVDNEATGEGGGGMYVDGPYLVSFDDSAVDGNDASGPAGRGGGVLSRGGYLYLNATDVTHNTAAFAGGGIALTGGQGSFYSARLQGNRAGDDGQTVGGEGGAVSMAGSATLVQFFGGELKGNAASTNGGGFSAAAPAGAVYFRGTVVHDNVAEGGNSLRSEGGGGIHMAGGQLRLFDSAVTANRADDGTYRSTGGGILLVDSDLYARDSHFQANETLGAGGAIALRDGSALLERVDVGGDGPGEGNRAGSPLLSASGLGAGIFANADSRVTMTGGSLSGNQVLGEGGGFWNSRLATFNGRGGLRVEGNLATSPDTGRGGGGIFNDGGRVHLNDAEFLDNRVVDSPRGGGGAVANDDGSFVATDTRFYRNQATHAGGGIRTAGGYLKLVDSELGGIAPADGNLSQGEGGGLWAGGVGDSRVVFDNTLVGSNRAGDIGGGAYLGITSVLIHNGSRFFHNEVVSSQSRGGGLYVAFGSVQIKNASLEGNRAARAGGGAFLKKGETRFVETSVSGNTAGQRGGGVFNGAFLRLAGSEIVGNRALENGGGIFNASGADALAVDTLFESNDPNDYWPLDSL